MRNIAGFCFWMLMSSTMGSAAWASDVNRTVAAGKRSPVGTFAIYSIDTCSAGGLADARVSKQPQNGKVEVVAQQIRIDARQCGGMAVYGRVVYYTPRGGFRGADSVSVEFTYGTSNAPRVTSQSVNYIITVK